MHTDFFSLGEIVLALEEASPVKKLSNNHNNNNQRSV